MSQKIIDGKRFRLVAGSSRKDDATRMARKYKTNKHYNVRIIKDSDGWSIWVHYNRRKK